MSDAQNDELYAEIGKAINAWSNIELNLSGLFGALMPTSILESQPLRAGFDVIVSLEARVGVIRELVERSQFADDFFKDRLNSLLNRLLKKYKRRHRIAHFTFLGGNPPTIEPFANATRNLMIHADGGSDIKAPDTLNTKQIRELRQSFDDLGNETWRFVQYLLHKRGLLLASQEPEFDPRHLIQSKGGQSLEGQ